MNFSKHSGCSGLNLTWRAMVGGGGGGGRVRDGTRPCANMSVELDLVNFALEERAPGNSISTTNYC